MNAPRRKVAVVGAGVIGQGYAGRLAAAGCDVWLLARGETFRRLRAEGIRLHTDGVTERPAVMVVDSISHIPPVDVAYLAVRADQIWAALPVLAGIGAPAVVTLVNLGADAGRLPRRSALTASPSASPGSAEYGRLTASFTARLDSRPPQSAARAAASKA